MQEVVARGRVVKNRAQQDVGDDAGDERAADPCGEGPAEEHVDEQRRPVNDEGGVKVFFSLPSSAVSSLANPCWV